MFHRRLIAALLGVAALDACDRESTNRTPSTTTASTNRQTDSARADSIARARQDSINRAQPGYIIDSVLPVEEEMRRFSAAVGGTPVTALANGSASREELVKRLVRAVSAQDTTDLRAMALTAREFADLVYPTSPYTHPPYRQPPGLVWSQIMNPSVSGFRRLMRRRGGMQYQYVSHTCRPQPERQGENRLWLECRIRMVGPERDTTTQRWFGTIIERGGQFKIVSFSNQF
jgi:hypothetical protein